jgi:eukaryotic-like serine/threonine-protein kinase
VELFHKVCEAVQYAHQSLVVHRDIKPSNIMIDATGAPKLLDFGIAKLLDPTGKAQAAATIFRLLTPDYASPEQIRGEPAGVASDVYSLGAVLYELLADSPPFRLSGLTPADAERAITQTGAPKPSVRNPSLRRQLNGDLDNIVLMAMRKEAKERYQSVEALSADLLRYLENRPVLARDYRPWERAVKFVRRHRIPTVAATAALASLVTGAVMAQRSAIRAEDARRIAVAERQQADQQRAEADRQRAEAARQAALAVAHAGEADKQRGVAAEQRAVAERRYDEEQTAIARILQDIFTMEPIQGAVGARRGVLEKAIPYLEKLAAEPRANDEVRENLAHAYESLGYLLASTTATSTGNDRPRGIELLKKARAMLIDLRRRKPDHRDYLVGFTQTCIELGQIVANTSSDIAEPQGYLREAIEAGRRALQLYPTDRFALNQLMRAYITRINALSVRDVRQVDLNDIAEYDRLATIAYERNPNSPRRFNDLGYIRGAEGTVHYLKGDYELARRPFEESLGYREKWAASIPHDGGAQRMLFVAHSHVADTYNHLDGPGSERSGKHYLAMIEIAERLAKDPNDRTSQYNLASGLSRYAGHRLEAGDAAAALPYAERSLAIFKTLVGPQESNLAIRQNHVLTLRHMGEIQRALGRPDEAVRHWREAMSAGDSLIERFDRDSPTLSYTARATMRLAQQAAAERRDAEALALARKSLALAERAAAVPGLSRYYRERLTQSRGEAALILAESAARSNNAALRAEAQTLAAQSAAEIDRITSRSLADWPAAEREKVKTLARAASN